ncbi:MAG: zf-HC2 domain-containing protein [Bacteroidales bacterium]
MRCISDELIQKFVDKEASAKEKSIVQSHLATCSKCAKKVEEKRYTANRIKELIGSLNKKEVPIPIFQEPENQKKTLYIHLKKAAYVASAACLLILFLILLQKPKNEIEFVYSYNVESEYNANLPLSEQEMVIEIIDSKGKLIKY